MSSFTNATIHQNDTSQSANQTTTDLYQRRESLVKPTWHNVCPGQMSTDTLDKLNKLTNGSGCGSGGYDQKSSAHNFTGTNNINQSNSFIGCNPQRHEEIFDVFGKVYLLYIRNLIKLFL